MLVSLWMSRNPVAIAPEASISDAAAIMSARHIRRLVVTPHGQPNEPVVGIITVHDLVRAFPHDLNPFSIVARERKLAQRVAEVMTRRPFTTTPATPVEEAAEVMNGHKVGGLPVVGQGRLVGVITESDIFRAFLEVVGVHEPGVRLMFDSREDEDVVGLVVALARQRGLRVASVLSMRHDRGRLAVVRVLGGDAERFIDDVQRSGHRLVSVVRAETAAVA